MELYQNLSSVDKYFVSGEFSFTLNFHVYSLEAKRNIFFYVGLVWVVKYLNKIKFRIRPNNTVNGGRLFFVIRESRINELYLLFYFYKCAVRLCYTK